MTIKTIVSCSVGVETWLEIHFHNPAIPAFPMLKGRHLSLAPQSKAAIRWGIFPYFASFGIRLRRVWATSSNSCSGDVARPALVPPIPAEDFPNFRETSVYGTEGSTNASIDPKLDRFEIVRLFVEIHKEKQRPPNVGRTLKPSGKD